MGLIRKDSLRRINGLIDRAKEHLGKLTDTPSLYDDQLWRHEMRNWIQQMEVVLPNVGKKTAQVWREILDDIKRHGEKHDNDAFPGT